MPRDIATTKAGTPKEKLTQSGDWKSTVRRTFLGSGLLYNILFKEKLKFYLTFWIGHKTAV